LKKLTVAIWVLAAAAAFAAQGPSVSIAAATGITCPACGFVNADGAVFCANCGAALKASTPTTGDDSQTKMCPQCGNLVEKDAKFCSGCGYTFAATGAIPKPGGGSAASKTPGVAIGVFGGFALPMGDMAAEDNGGDLGMSPKLGGKVLISPIPALDIDMGFAYHIGHKFKDWEPVPGIDEPNTSMLNATFGLNYKYMFGDAGVYVGGGGGYYMEHYSMSGVIMGVDYTVEYDLGKPGIYFGGGFLYKFGKVALDVSPRFNYVLNKGDFDVKYTFGNGDPQTQTATKDFNDTFFDLLFGVDFFI